MEIITKRFFITIVYLLGVATAFAEPPPPPGDGDGPDPPPPNISIDENLFVFLIGALFLGIYIIYKHQKKQKTPA
jgi:hypothetical protein